ncbi:MAG TPA: acetate--CoA ligase [Kofleriaceae bacterium]|nr:acetate--CoA ligase [Kofleriaceae bacterium]
MATLPIPTDYQAAIDALGQDEAPIPAPTWLAREAYVPNDALERRIAAEDPDAFWAEQAKLVDWIRPFDRTCEIALPDHRWFVGGQLNAAVNCIDRHALSAHRLKAALIWVGEDGDEQTYTYGRLYREVGRFGNALRKLGVAKGDRVIIYMPLVPEGIVAMLACARIGAIHSVVFAGMGTQALKSRIVDSGAKVVVCSDYGYRRGKQLPLKPAVDEAVRDLPGVEHVIVHRRGSRPGDAPVELASEREHDFYDVQDARAIHCPPAAMSADDPLFILYTSGTTGKPKGIVHATGGYLVGVTYLSRAFLQIGERDVYWSTSDIGWIVGHSFIVYGPLSIGATVLVREGVPDYPSPEVTWELCERYGVNVMFTAPTAVRMWMSHGAGAPGKYDLSRLRLIACAGEPLNPEAHRWAQRCLVGQGNGLVVDNWWQTEIAAPVIATLPTFDPRPGKVGKAMPGAELAILDAHGEPVPDGTGGQLVLRRPLPYMMRAIWNDRERYARAWKDGFYRAGDIAVRDRDGYIAVLGRYDDVLNVAGHRIGTADIEASLGRHAAVAESAAIGLPDPLKGERIKAFVVLRPGVAATAGLVASLKDHVRSDLGAIATPSEIELRASLPKTRSGKIVRRYLRAQELGEDPGDLSTLAD